MTTVKILKSERAIISEGLAEWFMEHSITDSFDPDHCDLRIYTDSPVVMFHLGMLCGGKIQIADFSNFIEERKKKDEQLKEPIV